MPVGSQKRSRFWYLLPILLQVIGGLIAYFALRNSSSTIAKNALYVGTILSAVTTAVGVYLYLNYHNDIRAAQERVKEGGLTINTGSGLTINTGSGGGGSSIDSRTFLSMILLYYQW